ncbi:MAG: indolepyruvate oxidoreductase subunit beta [Desulfuromonas sp.]|uniref:indolepyruvate oxidoreductase subunit beta n=1 Tax=Desulfuromonas sp. TaxID=892 RepID=UPI000CC0AA28|nr:indolepyruvate oxidoreductase subunit beta [Desulfuromonas sp.]PLX86127.1 MAG: indolepyruvate oxidoreductase subunit beta [Desulfuromonas sp.]
MTNSVKNILLAGVGGQGTLLASEVLSEALMLAGHDVKKSEIHGMSQRGGSVTSHVRFGPKVLSPLIPEGEADILFGFELLETYRNLPSLRAGGDVVANDLKVIPATVSMGVSAYPEDIPAKIEAAVPGAKIVNGMELAREAGNLKTANVALLGTLSRSLELEEETWVEALNKLVPAKFLEVNLKAFTLGRSV